MSAPPVWSYSAVDGAGRRERGVLEAASPAALARTLESRGLLVIDAEPAARDTTRPAREWPTRAKRDVLEITRALAALLAAGIPLARALSTVTVIVPGHAASVVDDVRAGIASGESLAAALARHPRLFDPLYVGVVRAGERGGRLADAFAALAAQLERGDRLRARLLGASIYPMLLAAAGMTAVGVLLFVVLPRFAELLESTRATLPRSTATLLAFSAALERGWPWLLGSVIAIVLAAMLAARTASGRRARARLLLHLPVIGMMRRHTLAARLARVLGVLLAGGAPLLGALDDARDALADPLAGDELSRIRGRVRDGAALNAAIAEGALFPPLLARLVAVGEEAGRLEEFLARAAEICEDKADRSLQRMVSLVEPAMILVLGALIALVALSLLQTIYGVDAGAFR